MRSWTRPTATGSHRRQPQFTAASQPADANFGLLERRSQPSDIEPRPSQSSGGRGGIWVVQSETHDGWGARGVLNPHAVPLARVSLHSGGAGGGGLGSGAVLWEGGQGGGLEYMEYKIGGEGE
ncbi:hypothetical protein Nepgr_003612 [Nepenthes gracilis]|uniref:Uncharacterized protein n=1 Tax=Nepenthes gracilis TaxID=150966 RepID=A0AAD3RZY1_NEPGR|nr:hypothetical protein Nepgr_003612 [Nepenthes gracilis]